MKRSEWINEKLMEEMTEVVVEYFPFVDYMEDIEPHRYAQIMDALTCDECSQKENGNCKGKGFKNMDSIMRGCIMPKVVG